MLFYFCRKIFLDMYEEVGVSDLYVDLNYNKNVLVKYLNFVCMLMFCF